MIKSQKENSGKEIKSAEETLRLIASLPAPEGLTERVQSRLPTEPQAGREAMPCSKLKASGECYRRPQEIPHGCFRHPRL